MIFPKMHGCSLGGLGALGHLFGGSGADHWSSKRILGSIISSLVMKLYVCVDVLVHVHSFCVMSMCRWMHTDVYRCHICMCESIYIHNLCIDAYLQICRYASMHIYLYLYLYIYRYTHICIYIYMCIYTYIHTCGSPDSRILRVSQSSPELPQSSQSSPSAPRALGELSPDSPRLWKVPPLRIDHFRAMCKVKS